MFNYDKLSQAIVRSGKSKAYLCRKIGKPEYYLRDVIKQKNKISEENQAILAAELGVTVAYLNDAEQKEKPTPVSESEQSVNIVKIAGRDGSFVEKRLSDKELQALKAFVDLLHDASDDL